MRANNRSGGPAAPPDEALVVDVTAGLNGSDVIKQADGIRPERRCEGVGMVSRVYTIYDVVR